MADEADFGDTAATAELTAAGKDPRYTLTATELTWATELKQALIDAKVELPATDFELAHFAIVSKGNIKKGVNRVTNFNKLVKPEYSYTYEEGLKAIGFMNAKWPGSIPTCGKAPNGGPMLTCDVNPYLPGELKPANTPEGAAEWKAFMLEMVVFFHVCSSDLDECRKGAFFITQCKGMGWKNFSMELEKRAAALYQDAIPCRFAGMPCVNAGPILRAMLKLCKLFLKRKIADRIIVCKQEELMTKYGFTADMLPPLLGGTCTEPTYETWAKAQLAAREVSKEKVKLEVTVPVEVS